MGHPSKFTQKIAAEICERLASGESLNAICKTKGMPSEAAVRLWVIDDREGFAANYERAREIQADHFVDEIVRIADGEPDPQVARVRIDARKWVAGKMRPEKYGEKIDVEHSGDAEKPIVHRIERVIVRRGSGD
jgi:hypothetical protein